MFRNLKLFNKVKYSLSISLINSCIFIEVDNSNHRLIYHKFNDSGILFYGEITEINNISIRFYIMKSMDTGPDRVIYDNMWNSFEDWNSDDKKDVNIDKLTE